MQELFSEIFLAPALGREGRCGSGGGWRVGGAFEGGRGSFWPFSLWFTQAGAPIGAKRQGPPGVSPGQRNRPIAARLFGSVKRSENGQKLVMGRRFPIGWVLGGGRAGGCRAGWRAPQSASGPPPPVSAVTRGPSAAAPARRPSRPLHGDPGVSGAPPPPVSACFTADRPRPPRSPLRRSACRAARQGGWRFGDGRRGRRCLGRRLRVL